MEKKISDTIRIARVMCIFFMMYVHIHPFSHEIVIPNTVKTFMFILVDLFGRASVPLLSIISGYLAYIHYGRESFQLMAFRRAKTLLVPMLFWSFLGISLAITLAILHNTAPSTHPIFSDGIFHTLNLWIGLTIPSFNPHLAFLRDVFICALLSPLIIWSIKSYRLIALAIIFSICTFEILSPLILRSQILLFYAIGIYLALSQHLITNLDKWSKNIAITFILLIVVLAITYYENGWITLGLPNYISSAFEYSWRLLFAGGFWVIAGLIFQTSFKDIIIRYEASIYLAFLCHVVLTQVLIRFWNLAFPSQWLISTLIYFIISPLLVLIIARQAHILISKSNSGILKTVTGIK